MATGTNPHPWDGTPASRRPSLTLSEAGTRIEDGDLLLWHGNYLISRAFEAWTHGWFSHAAFFSDWDGTAMVLQAEFPHIQAVPLWKTIRQYPGAVYWYQLAPEYRETIDVAKMLRQARTYLGLDFGLSDVLRDLMHRRFHWSLPRDSRKPKAMFCSEYVARCFRAGGAPILQDHEDMDTLPSDIAKSKNLVFQSTLKPDPE